MEEQYIKVCLNCQGNWEECKGINCQTWDGACCEDFNCKDMENRAFWYTLKKK